MCSEQRQAFSPPDCRISLKPFWWPTSCGSHGGCSCTWGFLGLWVAPLSSANPAPPSRAGAFLQTWLLQILQDFLSSPLASLTHYSSIPYISGEGSCLYCIYLWQMRSTLTAFSMDELQIWPFQKKCSLTESLAAPGDEGCSWHHPLLAQGRWGLLAVALPGGWDAVWLQNTAQTVHQWHVQLVLQEVNGRLAFHIKHNCIVLPFIFTKRLVLFTWDYYYFFCFNAFFFYDLWCYLWRIRRKNIYL